MALSAAVAYYSYEIFGGKFSTGKQEDLVFGIIILFILTPFIVLGLGTFGYFAVIGEYNDDKK